MASTTGQKYELDAEEHITDVSFSAATPVADDKEEVSSKAALGQDEDMSSVTASDTAPPDVHVFHKPPTRQFVLIMIA